MEADSLSPAALYDTIEGNTTKSSEDALTRSVISRIETKGTGFNSTPEVLQSGSEAAAALSVHVEKLPQ